MSSRAGRSRWNVDGSAVVKPLAELSTEAIGKKLREASADRSGPTSVVALPVLQELLALPNCDVNYPNQNGKAAIHFACQLRSDTEVLALLLSAGADVNAATHRGHTPLIYASGRVRNEVVECLLDHGADAATWTVMGVCAAKMARKSLDGEGNHLRGDLVARLEANELASLSPRDFRGDARAISTQEEHTRMHCSGHLAEMEEAAAAELAATLGAAAAESIEALSAALLAASSKNTRVLRTALAFSLAAGALSQAQDGEEEEEEEEEEEAAEEAPEGEEATEGKVSKEEKEEDAAAAEKEEDGEGEEGAEEEVQGGRWTEKRRMRRRARAMRRARQREQLGREPGTQERDSHTGEDARVEAREEEASDAETEAEDEEAAEDAADAEEEEEVLGFAASCEQLLRASRDEALGRCIGKGAKGRNRKPVRVVAGAIFAAIQAPGIVEALAANGTKLRSLVEASDSHMAAELVSRWPESLRDDAVCLRVWERLVKTSDGWCGEGQAVHAPRRSGGPRVAAWARALRWAASVGFLGWEACADKLLQTASEECGLEQLLATLRQVDERSTEPRRHHPPRDGEQESEQDQSEEQDASEASVQRPERWKASSAEELPPALRALLVERHGPHFGTEGGGAQLPVRPRAGGGRRGADKSGRAKLEELDAASMPLAQLAVAPVWLGTGPEVSALHATLRTLAAGSRQAEGAALRVGVDTEWADAAADEPSSEPEVEAGAEAAVEAVAAGTVRRAPPRVAVVQVAVSDQVWVLDALAAGPETGALLQWALACDDVALLGFAFSGDLAVLRPLCGGGELCASSLVDVQSLAMRQGEDMPSLRRVCARTIGVQLDKTEQCSDWARRPLEQAQFTYAALDAHILLQVYEALLAREQ